MNKEPFDCHIVISNYLWDGQTSTQRQTIHYVPHELAFRMGKPVLFVNLVPYSIVKVYPSTILRYRFGSLKHSRPPLTILNYWGHEWRTATRMAKTLPAKSIANAIIKRLKRMQCKNPIIIFSEPTHLPIIEQLRVDMVSTPVVWYSTDDFASDDPNNTQVLETAIARMPGIVDTVCTVSPTLKERFVQLLPTLQLNNAADRLYFQKYKQQLVKSGEDVLDESIKHPRVVYVGMINHRIAFEPLLKTVLDHPQVSFIFIGKEAVSKDSAEIHKLYIALKEAKNSHFIGERNRKEIAKIFSVCDIGIIPYTLSAFNMSSCPLKLYEYAASDLPVISTALPALEHSRRAAYLVDDLNFSHALDEVIGNYDQYQKKIIEFSTYNTWSDRIRELEEFVLEVTSKKT